MERSDRWCRKVMCEKNEKNQEAATETVLTSPFFRCRTCPKRYALVLFLWPSTLFHSLLVCVARRPHYCAEVCVVVAVRVLVRVLFSQGMDTGAGMQVFDAPVTVATVVSDADVHESGVQVFPIYSQPKYQVRIV